MTTVKIDRPKLDAVITAINSIYNVHHQAFLVGDHPNKLYENIGSLAILGFAKFHNLPENQVLPMFGEAYQEVLDNPDGTNHANIRAFMKCGLKGVSFEDDGIKLRPELQLIEAAWEDRAKFTPTDAPQDVRDAVEWVIDSLDNGFMRTAMKLGNFWHTNQAVKKAVLLYFRLHDNEVMGEIGPGYSEAMRYYDKVRTKFADWDEDRFKKSGIRVVPSAVARYGSFIAPKVVLMPSYTNIGAYVDEGAMVDTWATVGSCAQIGKNVHLSGGVGIGGVLEPLQANPTIIEDGCFIGARSEVVEGVIVREGSVVGMGCFIGQSTPIVNRTTGEITFGEIPPYSVVVSGTMPMESEFLGLQKYCVIIIKTVDAQTRAKTATNELLRG